MAVPVNLNAPVLDRDGRTLSTTDGGWLLHDGTYTYAWLRCDTAGAGCSPVPGRTSATYLLTTADIGRRIRSVVTTRNGLGPTSATSAASGTIVAAPPVNTAPPTVAGGTRVGSRLSSTLGAWSDPSPAAVTYLRQWQRCIAPDGLNCENIAAETGASYTLAAADVNKYVRVVIFAEGLGFGLGASTPLGPIVRPPAPIDPEVPPEPDGDTDDPEQPGADPPRKLRPFPRVIVAGRVIRRLTVVSGLVIRGGPRRATVTVRCRGSRGRRRGCPLRRRFRGRLSRRGTMRLRRFQRVYRPGNVIDIRITQRGAIGKFTRLKVRRRGVPARRDLCIVPGSSRPRRCPR